MLAVYIHWPFCLSKCPYCDFNSHVGDTSQQERWRIAYRRELEFYAGLFPNRRVTSIFFGGGTPSLMDVKTVDAVLRDIARLWSVDSNAEVTLEANPSSVEASKFADFRAAGVNRLSLGVQSLHDDVLRFFGRAHNASEAREAIDLASQHFPRFSFDLIYGYAGHTPEAWRNDLRNALALAHGHISLYQLTIEPHTQFFVRDRRGEILVAQEDDAVRMFEDTQALTADSGLPSYEISNHAAPGQESRHNLTYWRYEDYIGIGPGAHGRYRNEGKRHAVENIHAPDLWLQKVAQWGQGVQSDIILDIDTAMREALMMGLRTSEGIDAVRWAEKFSAPLVSFLPSLQLERLKKEGFVVFNDKGLQATAAGRQRLNAILSCLL